MSTNTVREPLPTAYYYFFWLFEPITTLLGAGYAVFLPEQYGADLLPSTLEPATLAVGKTVRGQMLIGALGSCFFLLAFMSLSMFPIIRKTLSGRPDVQEMLVKAFLLPLTVADILHCVMTLLPLPMSYLQTPAQWTDLINGNVWITVFLFAWRMSYFLGIGRPVIAPLASGSSGRTTTSSRSKAE